MVYSDIEKSLKQQCMLNPILIPTKVFENGVANSPQLAKIEDYYMRNLFDLTPLKRKMLKFKFMYAVIHNSIFNLEMAKRYRVSISDIQHTNNIYQHYLKYLISMGEYQQFETHLFAKAKESYSYELECLIEFEKLSVEAQADCCVPPRLWVQKQISLAEKKVSDLKYSMRELTRQQKFEKIEDNGLRDQKCKIQHEISKEFNKLADLQGKLKGKRPKGEAKRYFYIERFNSVDLINLNDSPSYFRMGSVSVVKSLLQEYCAWFNKVHKDEVKVSKQLERRKRQRKSYEEKNQTLIAERKGKNIALQNDVLGLLKKGLSLRKIAVELNKSYSKIQRAAKEISVLISLQ